MEGVVQPPAALTGLLEGSGGGRKGARRCQGTPHPGGEAAGDGSASFCGAAVTAAGRGDTGAEADGSEGGSGMSPLRHHLPARGAPGPGSCAAPRASSRPGPVEAGSGGGHPQPAGHPGEGPSSRVGKAFVCWAGSAKPTLPHVPFTVPCIAQARLTKETSFSNTAWPESSDLVTALIRAICVKRGVNFPPSRKHFVCEKTKN